MVMNLEALWRMIPALILAPLLPGIINRVKAMFAGRKGRPLLQTYFDTAKLLRKGAVFSAATTWMFRAGPILCLASPLAALALIPVGGLPGVFSFPCDFILAAYLLGVARLAVVLAALDTGSSFEGMGASREAAFGAVAEPVLFLTLLAAASVAHGFSLAEIIGDAPAGTLPDVLLALALFALLLVENSRIPVDDPNTHLELTMIHEVMVLDHSGPYLAFITYGSALKLWIYAALFSGLLLPFDPARPVASSGLALAGILATAVLVGCVESITARLRLVRVPGLLIGAGACSAFALIVTL